MKKRICYKRNIFPYHTGVEKVTFGKNNKLGPGFEKSDLYTGAKISILDKKDLVNINFKDWLVLSMCAIWNSGIEIIYAKDRIGKKNYPNAWYHAMHSFVLHPYLPKLVNE